MRECIRCGTPFEDRDLDDKLLTETEKACCPNCRERAWSRNKNRQSGGWFQRLIGLFIRT